MALEILDEWPMRHGGRLHVERARFEQKGNYDPARKPQRKLTSKEKQKFKERQEKYAFLWNVDVKLCECEII